jgi:hypothetical protein
MFGLHQAFLAYLEFTKPAWHAYPFTQHAGYAWPSPSLFGMPTPSPSLLGMPRLHPASLACLAFTKPDQHAYPFIQPVGHTWPLNYLIMFQRNFAQPACPAYLKFLQTCLASLAFIITFTQPVEYLAPYPACLALRIACTVYLALDSVGSVVKYLLLNIVLSYHIWPFTCPPACPCLALAPSGPRVQHTSVVLPLSTVIYSLAQHLFV